VKNKYNLKQNNLMVNTPGKKGTILKSNKIKAKGKKCFKTGI